MMKELDHLEIPVEVEGGNVITLYIDPQNKNKAKLYELQSKLDPVNEENLEEK